MSNEIFKVELNDPEAVLRGQNTVTSVIVKPNDYLWICHNHSLVEAEQLIDKFADFDSCEELDEKVGLQRYDLSDRYPYYYEDWRYNEMMLQLLDSLTGLDSMSMYRADNADE